MEQKQDGDNNAEDKSGKHKIDGPVKNSIEEQLKENSQDRESADYEPVFYYSRERRLERASKAVQAINKPGPAMKGGLVRVLFATRSGTLLFITIVILCIFMLFIYYTRDRNSGVKIGGNSVSVSALRYSGSTYVEIKKKGLGDDYYTGTVDLAVSIPQKLIAGEEAPIVNRRIFFTLEEQEEFRFSLPFDAPELILLMQAGNEIKTFQIKGLEE
jgi:hypothetical protein